MSREEKNVAEELVSTPITNFQIDYEALSQYPEPQELDFR